MTGLFKELEIVNASDPLTHFTINLAEASEGRITSILDISIKPLIKKGNKIVLSRYDNKYNITGIELAAKLSSAQNYLKEYRELAFFTQSIELISVKDIKTR